MEIREDTRIPLETKAIKTRHLIREATNNRTTDQSTVRHRMQIRDTGIHPRPLLVLKPLKTISRSKEARLEYFAYGVMALIVLMMIRGRLLDNMIIYVLYNTVTWVFILIVMIGGVQACLIS